MYTYICYAEDRTSRRDAETFTLMARNLREAISYARLNCRQWGVRFITIKRKKA
jgi:hypothetical protein